MNTLNSFPSAKAGEKRFVINLDPRPNEHDYKVELLPGRIEMVDGANFHLLGGHIKRHTLEGFGYPYYTVKMGPTASTRMMPQGDDAVERKKFVHTKGKLVDYNSKLPIVVYMPGDGELHYRVWSTSNDQEREALAEQE
eukprot:gene966-563_t